MLLRHDDMCEETLFSSEPPNRVRNMRLTQGFLLQYQEDGVDQFEVFRKVIKLSLVSSATARTAEILT